MTDEQGLEVSTNSADVVSVVDKFGKDRTLKKFLLLRLRPHFKSIGNL